jgi:4-carboxymuconolactone decarboxylase
MPSEPAPRVTPLLPPEWQEAELDALGAFPSGLKFVLQRWEAGGEDARGMYTLGFLAHYPALAKAFLTLNKHVAQDSTLNARERELLILRISWLIKAEYEMVQHVILGRRAGLTDEEIARVQAGPAEGSWSDADAAVLQAADDLYQDSCISDATWARLSQRYDHRQIMDIILLVGVYDVLGKAIKSFRIPLEPGVAGLDAATRARMFDAAT